MIKIVDFDLATAKTIRTKM